jgi:hypothetical protein
MDERRATVNARSAAVAVPECDPRIKDGMNFESF